jgi:hypothetical protein
MKKLIDNAFPIAGFIALVIRVGYIIFKIEHNKSTPTKETYTVSPTYYTDPDTDLCFATINGGNGFRGTRHWVNVPCTDKVKKLIASYS